MNWLSLNIGMEGKSPTGEGVFPYITRINMCRPKGYGFCAGYGLDFAYFGLKLGMVLE